MLIAIGATYVRGQVLEKQLNQEISNVQTNVYDSMPSKLSSVQISADTKALEEQQENDRKGGWATFIVLAVLFVFIQILGILFGFKWGFIRKESKKAYRYIKNFSNSDEFEDYYERQKDVVISKANEKLSILQSKMANYIGKTTINANERNAIQSANQRTFEKYIAIKGMLKNEREANETKQKKISQNIKNHANFKPTQNVMKEQTNQETNAPQDRETKTTQTNDDIAKRREILAIKKELKELQKNGVDENRILDLEEKLLELEN